MSIINSETTFLGYRRENGRVGVRNHVIILPLDDLSNAAAEAVARGDFSATAPVPRSSRRAPRTSRPVSVPWSGAPRRK